MRKILLIAFIVIFGCKDQKIKNDLSEQNISESVSSIKTSRYNADEKFGEIVKSDFLSSEEIFFNSMGNIERKLFKSNFYNQEEINFYDNKGFRVRQNSKSSNSGTYVTIYKYEYGLNNEQNTLDSIGKLYTKTKFIYDDDGNLSKEFVYDGDGSTLYTAEFKYDKDNNVIEVLNLNGNGKKVFHTTMTYDEHGNQITSVESNNRGETSKVLSKYTFDQNGNWIKEIVYKNDQLKLYIEREINYSK